MAWTTPRTWVTGEIVTASLMNTHVRDNLNSLLTVVEGDTDATNQHRHQNGTLAARPAPGNAGRLYVPTDLPMLLLDDGAEWLIPSWSYDEVQTEWEECAHVVPDSADRSAWLATVSGSAVVAGSGGANDTEWKLRTGTTNGSAARVNAGGSNNPNFLSSRKFVMYLRFKAVTNVANQKITVGLSTATDNPDTPTECVMVRKTDAGNLIAVIRSSSTDRMTQDLGVAGTSATDVIFEHDGTDIKVYLSSWNAAGLKGTLSSTLPTAQMDLFARVQNDGSAGEREMRLDTIGLHIAR